MRYKIAVLPGLFILVLFTVSCSQGGGEESHLGEGIYPVDRIFRRFYNQLGGQNALGPAISPVFLHDGVVYQYVVAVLMAHDSTLPFGQQTHLAPLGLDMGISELPVPQPKQTEERYVGGHIISKDFVPFFDRFGGEDVVGEPLSEIIYDSEKKRFEQFFENLGFYRLENEPTNSVHLLAYGAWKCSSSCRHSPPQGSLIVLPSLNKVPFLGTVASLGSKFTGFALTEPYMATDGNLEQIYEHVVMIANPEYPDRVSLRPIPEKVGISPDSLEQPSDDPNMFFYLINGESGYNVPVLFMDYIKLHGGVDITGAPITRLTQQSELVYRQCFKHLCLDELKDPFDNSQIQPAPLGYTYRELFYEPTAGAFDFRLFPEVSIQIWESYPLVAPDQEQEIGVSIFSNNDPLPDAQPVLILTMPDGSKSAYPMPPTGDDGQTRLRLEPINADNGTLIPYQVCVVMIGEQNFCVMDSYLVWNADYTTVIPQVPQGNGTYLPFVLQNVKVYLPSYLETFKQYLPFLWR